MGVVFAKTASGQDEIANRNGGLSPRVRRVLILVDGRKTVTDLREVVAADDLTHTLGALEELGLIEVRKKISAIGASHEPAGPLPSITAFRELPAAHQSKELDMARNFMINTLKNFCSLYGPISLMSNINAASSHEALRELYPEWYRLIVDSRSGRRRAEDLRKDLLKVL
ncbi:hypothetical protein LLG90_18385 [Aromatoleum toluclasticum]|uniref:hypothetical protein n=1 Tax=Aromatoleum toluclasticum TaxID=92003 RepID=UPI001D18224E|nr:hypothetical protein [Aromatoleum toluclasticum]MCC4117327.1 hypothetical protein [Aromatoleum toluclasticum]